MPDRRWRCLVIAATLGCLSGCALPDEVADLHRQALTSERNAVRALNRLSNETPLQELPEIRESYERSYRDAGDARERLRDLLERRKDSIFIGSKIEVASELNADFLRCHTTLDERASMAFRFVERGRGSRDTIDEVWGLVDPRTCFDQMALAWEELLE